MLEVLITMLIIAFGLLGFVGLQAQTTLSQVEAYQRSQALVLLNDIAQRIALNPKEAAAYVAANVGTTDPGNCATATTTAGRDLCEWSLLIQGATETQGTARLGAMTGARGCITAISATQYAVAIAWQGLQRTGAPATSCGQDSFSSEDTRRAVTTVVTIATLGA